MTNNPTKIFRVKKDTGEKLIATSELIGIDTSELLEKIIEEYVLTVRSAIIEVADNYPSFSEQYPFINR